MCVFDFYKQNNKDNKIICVFLCFRTDLGLVGLSATNMSNGDHYSHMLCTTHHLSYAISFAMHIICHMQYTIWHCNTACDIYIISCAICNRAYAICKASYAIHNIAYAICNIAYAIYNISCAIAYAMHNVSHAICHMPYAIQPML